MKNKKALICIAVLLIAVIGGYCVYSMTREKTKEEQLNELFSKPPSAYQKPSTEAKNSFIGERPVFEKGKNHSDAFGNTFSNGRGWQ